LLLWAGRLPAGAEEVLAIQAGQIWPGKGEPIFNGVLLIREGKIAALGPDVAIPPGARVLDARTKVIIPGLVDAYTTLNQPGDAPESITPELKALEGFDFWAEFPLLLAGGVTTVYLSPGERRLLSGQGAVVKLAGGDREARVLRESAGLRVTLGEAPKNPPDLFDPPVPPSAEHPIAPARRQFPTSRLSEFSELRRIFRIASGSAPGPIGPEALSPWGSPERRQLVTAQRVEALQRVLRGEIPLRVRADTASDIRGALRLAAQFHLPLVIEGGVEAYRVAGELARAGVPVVVDGIVRPGVWQPGDYTRDLRRGKIDLSNAAQLAAAGVPVAIHAPDDRDIPHLLLIAGAAISYGLSSEAALRAITLTAAEILGVADRVGSLEVGKDADLVILSGDPFDLRTRVEKTLVNGRMVAPREAVGALEGGGFRAAEEPARPQRLRAVWAGRIHTGTRGLVTNGMILIEGRKIQYVGPRFPLPEGVEVIDASDSVVIPGLIDIHSYLGLHADRLRPTEVGDPLQGEQSLRLRLSRAVVASDEAFAEVRRSGVTTVLLAPPQAGQAVALKLAGKTVAERVIRDPAALKIQLGSGPIRGRIWQARTLIQQARSYQQQWRSYERQRLEYQRELAQQEAQKALGFGAEVPPKQLSEPRPPRRDENLEILGAALEGKLPLLIEAHRADEIQIALRFREEAPEVDLIVVGAEEAFRLIEPLRKSGVAVALGPPIVQRVEGKIVNNAAQLSAAGVPIALQTSATWGTQFLGLSAGMAIHQGLDPVEALRAVTIRPAQLLHIDDRVGSLEVGKDADLVFLSGEPLALTTRVERVMIEGEVVFEAAGP